MTTEAARASKQSLSVHFDLANPICWLNIHHSCRWGTIVRTKFGAIYSDGSGNQLGFEGPLQENRQTIKVKLAAQAQDIMMSF